MPHMLIKAQWRIIKKTIQGWVWEFVKKNSRSIRRQFLLRVCIDVMAWNPSVNTRVSKLYRIIDYCEETEIPMQDEVMLVVTGAQYIVPKGNVLRIQNSQDQIGVAFLNISNRNKAFIGKI